MTKEEWISAFQMAEVQSLLGILLSAIEKLRAEDKSELPPKELIFQLIGTTLQIEEQNRITNRAAVQLTSIFKKEGIRSCVLKGQGIAQLYAIPQRRQSGDIDLWVEGGRNKILQFIKSNSFSSGQVVIHHADVSIIEGIETEIHFIPCYSCNPFLHRKLQAFFQKHADVQFSNFDEKLGFSYPTLRFNAVYLLSHITSVH